MNPRRWTVGLAAFAVACGGVPTFASSTFDNDDEGWTIAGDADPTPELSGSAGNPGGHICATDQVGGDIWYFIAPQKFLGDASRVYGARLTWDLKQFQQYQQIKGRDAVLQGNGLSLVFNIKATPGLDWTPYAVRIDDSSGWKIDQAPDFPAATEVDLRTTLRNVDSLRLRGEFVDGPDRECLDNVYFGVK